MHLMSPIPALPEAATTPLGSEVYRGLTSRPKTLAPWLFYDAAGSELFEQITTLPEYYPTRIERGIFKKNADEIISLARHDGRLTIVELGAGTASKTGILLKSLVVQQGHAEYLPIDVSSTALEEAKANLEQELPEIKVSPRVGDYTSGLCTVPIEGRRLVLFIGSSIGNFDPADALALLVEVRSQLKDGDCLLLGTDMVKDEEILTAAYNDAAGITATFNKNILTRINREFDANFNIKRFRHKAVWEPTQSRIEMHLESLIAQRVSIPALELDIAFLRGESIHTENSYKYTQSSIENLLTRAGFVLKHQWTDENQWFYVTMATV